MRGGRGGRGSEKSDKYTISGSKFTQSEVGGIWPENGKKTTPYIIAVFIHFRKKVFFHLIKLNMYQIQSKFIDNREIMDQEATLTTNMVEPASAV